MKKAGENGPGRGSCLYKGIVGRRIKTPAGSPMLWAHSCSWKSLLGESYRAGRGETNEGSDKFCKAVDVTGGSLGSF